LAVPGSDFALSEDGTRLSTVVFPPYNHEGFTVSIHEWDLPADLQPVQASGYSSSSIQVDAGIRRIWLNPYGILRTAFDNGPFRFWDVLAGGKAVYPISCCVWTEDMVDWFSSKREPRHIFGDLRTGEVMIWDLANDKQINTFQVAEPDELAQVFISPDGERLVTTNIDTTVYIWDVATGKKLLTLPGPATVDNSFWFSADGKWLAIADCTGTVVVRDVASGEEKLRFSGTSACITAVAFSPDGKLLAVNAGDRGLKILDFETGQELLTLPGGSDVEFTPDGTRVIMATHEEVGGEIVRTYLLRLEDIVALAKTRVTRLLTTEECQQYLHMETCPLNP
jgi:WD40 repeat protein